MPEQANKVRSFQADGQVFDIPVAEVDSFLKDMPKAAEVRSYKIDNDTLDIPVPKVQEFLADMPDAKPLHDYEDFIADKDAIDYVPFDKSMVQRSPRARQNFERWQQDQQGEENITQNGLVATPRAAAGIKNQSQSKKLTPEDIAYAKTMLPEIDRLINDVKIPESKPLDEKQKKYGMYAGGVDLGNKERNTASTTKSTLLKAKDYYEAVANGDSNAASKFWSGLKTIDLENTLTFGIKGMANAIDTYQAAKNYSAGTATPEEENLLIAKAMLEEIQSVAQEDRAISVGSGLAEMAPWLAQFAATGGIGTMAAKATAGSAISKKLADNTVKKLLGEATTKLTTKEGARLFGSKLVSAAAQTAAQVPIMGQGTAERMTDQYALDDSRELAIQEEGEGFGEALLRTYGTNYLENVSERGVGDLADYGLKKGINSFLKSKTFGKTKVADLIEWSRKNPYIKLTNQTLGLNTPLSENIEEAFTGLTQPFVAEDNWTDIKAGVSDYFKGENLYRVFLTTAAMGAGMGATQSPLQIYNTAKSEQGRKLVEDAFDDQANGLFYSAATAPTLEEREKYFDELVKLTGLNEKELNPVMHYYQTVLTQIENGIDPRKQSEIIQPEAPQQTVDPRQTHEAKIRQFAEGLTNKDTGTIQTVELVQPEGTDNTHWFVAAGQETDLDGGSMLIVDDLGNQKFVTKDQLAGDIQEISVDDFVNNQLSEWDLQQQQQQIIENNTINYNGIDYILNGEQTDKGYIGINPEDGSDIEIPFDAVQKSKSEPVSEQLTEQAVPEQQQPVEPEQPKTRPVVQETINGNKYDFVENEDGSLDVVIGSKQTPEKVLSALEKYFKDNKNWEVVADKIQVEIPASNRFEEPTLETKINGIRIQQKNVNGGTSTNVSPEVLPEQGSNSVRIPESEPEPVQTSNPVSELTQEQKLQAEIKELETDLKTVRPEYQQRYVDLLNQKKQQLNDLLNPKQPEIPALTPEQVDQRINSLVDEVKAFDEIPDSHSTIKSQAGQVLRRRANEIDYKIGKDTKGNTVLFDENNNPVVRKTAQRTPQEEIDTHPSLEEYQSQNFVNFAKSVLSDNTNLTGIKLGDLSPKEVQSGIKNVLEGKKTVAANKLLDALEEMFNTGEVSFKATTTGDKAPGITLDEFIETITDDGDYSEQSYLDNVPDNIISKIETGEELSEQDIIDLENAWISNEQIDEIKQVINEKRSEQQQQPEEGQNSVEKGIQNQSQTSGIEGTEETEINPISANNSNNSDKKFTETQNQQQEQQPVSEIEQAESSQNSQLSPEEQKIEDDIDYYQKSLNSSIKSLNKGRNGRIEYLSKLREKVINGFNYDTIEKVLKDNGISDFYITTQQYQGMKGSIELWSVTVSNKGSNSTSAVSSVSDLFHIVRKGWGIDDTHISGVAKSLGLKESDFEKKSNVEVSLKEGVTFNLYNNPHAIDEINAKYDKAIEDEKTDTNERIQKLQDKKESLKNEKLSEQPSQPDKGTGLQPQQGENQPEEKQGKGNQEGLEENEVTPILPLDKLIETGKKNTAAKNEIKKAEKETEPNPTEEQKESGEYKKGRANVNGFDISIESVKGTVRSGKDETGKEWSVTMNNTYGYFERTNGYDGDEIDVFIGNYPNSEKVFVVDQVNPKTGEFDEHKVMLGFESEFNAKQHYLANYEEGWKGFGEITELSIDEFKKWLKQEQSNTRAKRKPVSEMVSVKKVIDTTKENEQKNSNLAENKEDGFSQQVTPRSERSQNEINSRMAEISSILRGNGQDNSTTLRGPQSSQSEQEKQLKEYAESNNLWLYKSQVKDLTSKQFPSGKEADVFLDKSGTNVIKIVNYKKYSNTPLDFISNRIETFNSLFPETSYEITGFTETDKGLSFILSQPFVKGTLLNRLATSEKGLEEQQKRVVDYMADKFGMKTAGLDAYENDNYKIEDVHLKNVIEGADGQLYFIDVIPTAKKKPAKQETQKELSPAEKRLAELNERMKKLLNPEQDNNVVQEPADSYGKQRPNPEIMAIGTEMATLHIETGKVKFADFAKQMVADLGESVKPYLKSFYNGARDLPGMEEFEQQMDEYSFVKNANIDELLKKVNSPQESNDKPIVPEGKKVNLPLDDLLNKGKQEVVKKQQPKEQQSNENNVNLDNQNNEDVHDTAGNSEQYSPEGETDLSEDGADVQGNRGRSRSYGSRNSRGGRKGNRGQAGSKSGSGLFADLFGEQSDNELPESNRNEQPESSDAGTIDGRGNSLDSPEGLNDEQGTNDVNNKNAETLSESFKEQTARKLKQQKAAEIIPVKVGDITNIRETLPFLLDEQQDDVLKAETRFFDPKHQTKELAYGKGMLFTNGTGTGKTYTGLGIVKRFVKQGKTNILIVVPSQPKVTDWANDGKNLGLSITPLEDTSTGGEGIVVTTYSNFQQNIELSKRDFDLVVYDESHRLMQEKKGAHSSTTYKHYQISNKDQWNAEERIKSVDTKWIEYNAKQKQYTEENRALNNDQAGMPEVAEANVRRLATRLDELKKILDAEYPALKERAKQSVENTKVVFLSATPFKGHFNLRYANGYLFDWSGESETNARGSRVDAESRFYLEHFGGAYEWRYHRLQTRQNANADAIAMQEVQFAEGLMDKGVISGRAINSERDYERSFPKVAGMNTDDFNAGFNDIYNHQTNEFDQLRSAASKIFYNYNYTTQLLESLKTSMSISRIQKHLDLGRKVVVFHRRKQANVLPPFRSILDMTISSAENVLKSEYSSNEDKDKARLALQQAAVFEQKYSDLLDYEQTLNYNSAIDQITTAFGNRAVYVNGDISTKEKNNAIKNFNTDGSGIDVIVVQEESGKEGISLHDTSGKHQRVTMSMSMPISSITALQIEGRTYRIGQETNAIFEYPLLGLDMEVEYFGRNINRRLSTTENLAVGEQSRDLIRSFAEGVLFNSDTSDPNNEQGTGGKEYDKKAQQEFSEFRRAVMVYNTNQKTRGRRDQREGIDYYPTPEPVGQKMVEWLGLQPGETVLEPSAGHGAIAMWVPSHSKITAVEPSYQLFSKLNARSGGGDRRIINDTFENLDIINKYNGIAMNPPFGSGGKMAMNHLEKAFNHLKEGGRVVALIPNGGSMQKRLDEFLYGTDKDGNLNNPTAALVVEIKLPGITFQQAGTTVNAKIVVIDKMPAGKTAYQMRQEVYRESNKQAMRLGGILMSNEEINTEVERRLREQKPTIYTQEYDLSFAEKIDDLFDEIEYIDIKERPKTAEENEVVPQQQTPEVEATGTKLMPVAEFKHTQTGQILYTVNINGRSGEYKEMVEIAKKHKPFSKSKPWNNFSKGFLFENRDDAVRFKNEVEERFGNQKESSRFDEPNEEYRKLAESEINNAYGSEQKHREAIERTEQFVNENSGLWTSDRQLRFLFGESPERRNREPKGEPKILEKIKQRTVLEDFKESGYVDFTGITVSSPKDIADLFSIHRSPYIEKFHAIFIKNGKIVGTSAITTNTAGTTQTFEPEKIKELYEKFGANGVYYLHNHPSGNHKVSEQDVWVTNAHERILKPQDVNLLGHIIIDTDKFSFINTVEYPFKQMEKFGYYDAQDYITNGLVEEHNYPNVVPHLFSERESIIIKGLGDQRRMLEIAKALLSGRGYKGAIVYLSSNLSIAAYDIIPEGATMQDAIRISKEGIKNNLGTKVVFIHDGTINDKALYPSYTLGVIDVKNTEKDYAKEPQQNNNLVAEQLWEPDPKDYPLLTDYLKAVKESKVNNTKYAEPIFIEDEGWAIKTLPHKHSPIGGVSAKTYPSKELAQIEADIQDKRIAEKIRNINIAKEIIGEYGARNLDKAEKANFRMNNLTVAREMESMGKDPKTIKLATSWEKGVDGKWRHEIPDGELRMNYMDASTLEQAVKWDELFEAYPELKNVNIGALSPDEEQMEGSFWPKDGISETGTIFAGGDGMEQVKSVLLHEVQHAIQHIEGFAAGGNEMSAKSTMTLEEQVELQKLLNDLHDLQQLRDDAEFGTETRRNAQLKILELKPRIKKLSPLSRYQRLAGEVEARNVQKRMNMDDWERHNSMLEDTEDVKRSEQIVTVDSKGSSRLYRTPLNKTFDDAKNHVRSKKNFSPENMKRIQNALIDGERETYDDIEDLWLGNIDLENAKIQIDTKNLQDRISESFKLHKNARSVLDLDLAIQIYMDTKADPTAVKRNWEKLDSNQKRIVTLSENLTDDQKEIAASIRKFYDELGKKALENEVISNILENYVARKWNLKGKELNEYFRKFGLKTGHSKLRKFSTVIDGWGAGYKLKIEGATTNLAIVRREIHNVIENRKLMEAGLKLRDEYGQPLFSTRPMREAGYVMIEHPNFSKWKTIGKLEPSQDIQEALLNLEDYTGFEEGKLTDKVFSDHSLTITEDGTIIRKEPIYAPEHIAKRLNNILGTSLLNKFAPFRVLSQFNYATKAMILSYSFFHHQAFARSYYLAGAMHKPKDLNLIDAYKSGFKQMLAMGPEIKLLIKNGLTTGTIQEWDEVLSEQKTQIGRWLDKFNATAVVKDKILEFHKAHTDFLFKEYGTGLKIKTAVLELQEQLKKYPKEDPNEIAKRIAKLVNDDFGGLHLERMGRNKTKQHFLRLLLLAPDWTESNVRTLVKAFHFDYTRDKGDRWHIPKEEWQMYRKFWGRAIVRTTIASTALNLLMAFFNGNDDDDDYWDTLIRMYKEVLSPIIDKDLSELSLKDMMKSLKELARLKMLDVNISTPVKGYKKLVGEEVDENERYYYSIGGHFKDPVKWILDPGTSLKNKGSVLTSSALQYLSGENWQGKRFTSIDELLGLDNKGVYLTSSDKNGYRVGDPKGGKLAGHLNKYGAAGESGAVQYIELPSFAIGQIRGYLPIPLQNTVAWLQGDSDSFDMLTHGLGFHVSKSKAMSKEDQLKEQYKDISYKAILHARMINDARVHNETDKLKKLKSDPMTLKYNKINKVVNNIKSEYQRREDMLTFGDPKKVDDIDKLIENNMKKVIEIYNEK